MSLTAVLGPSDLLLVRTKGWAGNLIRLGEAMMGLPNMSSHVAVAHHLDETGKFWWLLEGRPGGVGWADSRKYEHTRLLMNNIGQPRTGAQREAICIEAEHMIGTSYDWAGIADATLRAFHMPELWRGLTAAEGPVPAQVICSSYAAFLYERAGCQIPPHAAEDTTPGDWCSFIMENGWYISPH